MTLKLHKVECRAVVGHYDDQGQLVNEELSQAAQSIYQLEQFAPFWNALKDEVDQRNAAAPEPAAPNRRQRRASQPRKRR